MNFELDTNIEFGYKTNLIFKLSFTQDCVSFLNIENRDAMYLKHFYFKSLQMSHN